MRVLYLGLEPPEEAGYFHYPVIRTVLRPDIGSQLSDWGRYTHIILTSKTAARLLCARNLSFEGKQLIAVGSATAALLPYAATVAEEATAEGVVATIEALKLKNPLFFWPRSALARPVVSDYLRRAGHPFREAVFYDTLPQRPAPLPDLEQFDKILFTSPSTVEAFFNLAEKIPETVVLEAIGPVTERALQKRFPFS